MTTATRRTYTFDEAVDEATDRLWARVPAHTYASKANLHEIIADYASWWFQADAPYFEEMIAAFCDEHIDAVLRDGDSADA